MPLPRTTQKFELEMWGGGPNPETDLLHHVSYNGTIIGRYLTPAEVGETIAAQLIRDFNDGKIRP